MLDCIQPTFEKLLYLGSWLVGLDQVPLEIDSYCSWARDVRKLCKLFRGDVGVQVT